MAPVQIKKSKRVIKIGATIFSTFMEFDCIVGLERFCEISKAYLRRTISSTSDESLSEGIQCTNYGKVNNQLSFTGSGIFLENRFSEDQYGIRPFLIRTLWPEFWGHPHLHGRWLMLAANKSMLT